MASLADSNIAAHYAELHCLSNFSFLRGVAHADQLVERAAELGYAALAITDECSVAGVVRAYAANRIKADKEKNGPKAKDRFRIPLIIGSEFTLDCGLKMLLLATNRQGYGQLSGIITAARRRAPKGEYQLNREQLTAQPSNHCLAIYLPSSSATNPKKTSHWLTELFPNRCWLGIELLGEGNDQQKLAQQLSLAAALKIPALACGDVHMASANQQPLQDTVTAIRLGKALRDCGKALFPNAERHLRSRSRVQKIYPAALLAETIAVARRCTFCLSELQYEYPAEIVPTGHTLSSWLRELTYQGAKNRWPNGITEANQKQIEHELQLITAQKYEAFFLTVEDVVRFARSQNILCQGRGSAANSIVCYALGITEVDPARANLLFERFISIERNEPPDIDVDFEHERREEVIQYIYKKYGRHRAAIAATIISYRARSAIRDVGKALALPIEVIDRLAGAHYWFDGSERLACELNEAGIKLAPETIKRLLHLVQALLGTPRHLSQHVGGFVIAADDLAHLVPVENASMEGRTVIQWDKDDLESLGLLKVDVLALGMLTALRKSFDLIHQFYGQRLSLEDIEEGDSATYEMIQRADTIGVFQIESRAQMTMLPRLKPATFYDLVIEIAIVRPGPIQGDMVHPYLARRRDPSLIEYPSPEVEEVLQRTLGVPIFQEQVMKLAIVAADFTPGEADELRRAMAAWKRKGGLEPFRKKLFKGMAKNKYPAEFAERIYKQILGFGDYGFPESHSASFALLAYASAWLKCHYPAAFTCALLNSQPMGFYQPSQLVQDAQRHSVEVLPADVQFSHWDSSLTSDGNGNAAIRLGLHRVKGLSREQAEQLITARDQRPFQNLNDLNARSKLRKDALEALAAANALNFTGHRYQAFWAIRGVEPPMPLFDQPPDDDVQPMLRIPSTANNIAADYQHTGLSLEGHPLAILRPMLNEQNIRTAEEVANKHDGAFVSTAGLVIGRQRPGSAKGVMFITIEDETGYTNVVVWKSLLEKQRSAALKSRLLLVKGKIQNQDNVLHLVAHQLEDLSRLIHNVPTKVRSFH